MSCLGPAPTTIDEWLAIIDRCATLAGGPNWEKAALLGAETVIVMILAATLFVALVKQLR